MVYYIVIIINNSFIEEKLEQLQGIKVNAELFDGDVTY